MLINPIELRKLAERDPKAAQFQAKRHLKSLPSLRKLGEKVEQISPDVAIELADLLSTQASIRATKARKGWVYLGTDLLTGVKYTRIVLGLTHAAFMKAYIRAGKQYKGVNRHEVTHWVAMGPTNQIINIIDEHWQSVFVFELVGEIT